MGKRHPSEVKDVILLGLSAGESVWRMYTVPPAVEVAMIVPSFTSFLVLHIHVMMEFSLVRCSLMYTADGPAPVEPRRDLRDAHTVLISDVPAHEPDSYNVFAFIE